MLEFLWQYIAGPIVAEALNGSATWKGVEALAGYNMYNTILWGFTAVLGVYVLQRFFREKEIELRPETALKLLPVVFLAGVLRFAQDAFSFPLFVEVLLITPVIHAWMAAAVTLMLYRGLDRKAVYLLSVLAVAVFSAVVYMSPAVNPAPLIAVSAATAAVSGLYFFVFTGKRLGVLPLVLAVASQFFEAFSSMYAVSQGFEPRQLLTSTVVDVFGPMGFLGVKCVVLLLALKIYFDMDESWRAILLLGLYTVGFATGIRVLLRAATGV